MARVRYTCIKENDEISLFHNQKMKIWVSNIRKHDLKICNYRTRAIITRGLYTFYPLFEVQKRFFKGLVSWNSCLMYG